MWFKCPGAGGGWGVDSCTLDVDVAYAAWFFKPSLLSRQKYNISYTHIGPASSLWTQGILS